MAEPPPEADNFSYATEEDPRLKRLLIRAVERMTGQPYLKQLYDEHRSRPVAGEDFWAAAIRSLELKIDCNEEALRMLPGSGPLVIVANHPFGVLDGLIISHLTSKVRTDFLVLTNSVLYRAEEIRGHLLPIDFAETREALDTNLKSRAQAKAHLMKGGSLVIFPAGGASTAPRLWSKRAVDAEWKNFTARLILAAKAPVAPVYFAGQNSRLFQIASHISLTFRLSLFFKEVYDKIGSEIRIRIGGVIPFSELERLDRKDLMAYLRTRTYALKDDLPGGADGSRRAPPGARA
jgi:putative hemolysin